MEVFSTRGLPSAQKVSFWNSISSEVFAAMEIAPRNPVAFDGQIRRESVGALTLMDVRSAAVCIRHTAGHLARRSHASYLLLAPLNGAMQLELPGSDPITVLPHEMRLIDNSRPYTIRHGDNLQTVCLDIPHELMSRIVTRPERLVGVRPTGGSRVQQSLITVLRTLSAEQEAAAPLASAAQLLADALVGLVGAAFADKTAASHRPADRLARIHAAIDARAHDAGLRQEDIALEFGLSARTLRMVLGRSGESFAKYLLRRRLEQAAAALRSPTHRPQSVMQVALACGFNNATHFGYAFKQKYGVTPSAYRAQVD